MDVNTKNGKVLIDNTLDSSLQLQFEITMQNNVIIVKKTGASTKEETIKVTGPVYDLVKYTDEDKSFKINIKRMLSNLLTFL